MYVYVCVYPQSYCDRRILQPRQLFSAIIYFFYTETSFTVLQDTKVRPRYVSVNWTARESDRCLVSGKSSSVRCSQPESS